MKIDHNGKKIEAFNLIMKKQYAQEILAGTKTAEFRAFSPFFIRMFTIEENFYENQRRIEEAEAKSLPEPEMLDDISPVRAIHFHPYSNGWHLDCLVDDIKIVGCDAGGAKELRDDWGSHDLDEFQGVPDGQGPLTFALHITEIISHHGL